MLACSSSNAKERRIIKLSYLNNDHTFLNSFEVETFRFFFWFFRQTELDDGMIASHKEHAKYRSFQLSSLINDDIAEYKMSTKTRNVAS